MAKIIITLTDKNNSFSYDIEVPNDVEADKLLTDITAAIIGFDNKIPFNIDSSLNLIAPKNGMHPIDNSKTLLEVGVFNGDYILLEPQRRTSFATEKFSDVVGKTMKLIHTNDGCTVDFIVNKKIYIIGKKRGNVDGYIANNPVVSREHCKIVFNGSTYTIIDLNSKNGTYINQSRLTPNNMYILNNNDVLKIANCTFNVIIG